MIKDRHGDVKPHAEESRSSMTRKRSRERRRDSHRRDRRRSRHDDESTRHSSHRRGTRESRRRSRSRSNSRSRSKSRSRRDTRSRTSERPYSSHKRKRGDHREQHRVRDKSKHSTKHDKDKPRRCEREKRLPGHERLAAPTVYLPWLNFEDKRHKATSRHKRGVERDSIDDDDHSDLSRTESMSTDGSDRGSDLDSFIVADDDDDDNDHSDNSTYEPSSSDEDRRVSLASESPLSSLGALSPPAKTKRISSRPVRYTVDEFSD